MTTPRGISPRALDTLMRLVGAERAAAATLDPGGGHVVVLPDDRAYPLADLESEPVLVLSVDDGDADSLFRECAYLAGHRFEALARQVRFGVQARGDEFFVTVGSPWRHLSRWTPRCFEIWSGRGTSLTEALASLRRLLRQVPANDVPNPGDVR